MTLTLLLPPGDDYASQLSTIMKQVNEACLEIGK